MKRQKLHKEDIKAGLRKKFGSLAAFEREFELPEESVSDVLRGKSVQRTAEAMAQALGVPVTSISASPRRVRKSVMTNNTSGKTDLHCLNAQVK